MIQVSTPAGRQSLALDVCSICPAIWFDATEFKSVPRRPPEVGPEEHLSPESREQLALYRIKQLAEQEKRDEGWDWAPDETWQWIPGILGLPVELDAPCVKNWPLVTWSVLIVCVVVFLSVVGFSYDSIADLANPGNPFMRWGFIPAQWSRLGGMTAITSFFLHAGIFHLLGNMYFLFVFGDNVEDHLGRLRYLALLLMAHLAGTVAQDQADREPMTLQLLDQRDSRCLDTTAAQMRQQNGERGS